MPLTEEDRAALSAYLDGELDEEATHQIEARLTVDPELRLQFETLRQTWNLLDYLPRAVPSMGFTSRTMERLTMEKQAVGASTWTWTRDFFCKLPVGTVAWAAVVLLAGVLGYALGGRLAGPADPADNEETLVRHLRVIERWPVYQDADDLDFVRQLDKRELFGNESGY